MAIFRGSPVGPDALLRHATDLLDLTGMYLIFARDSSRLLALSGYYTLSDEIPARNHGCELIYVGSTTRCLGTRLGQHLNGDARVSTLRETIGCIMSDELGIKLHRKHNRFYFADGEAKLSEWMKRNLRFSVLPTDQGHYAERFIIDTIGAPLNIAYRRLHPFAQHLMKMRAHCREHAVCCSSSKERSRVNSQYAANP